MTTLVATAHPHHVEMAALKMKKLRGSARDVEIMENHIDFFTHEIRLGNMLARSVSASLAVLLVMAAYCDKVKHLIVTTPALWLASKRGRFLYAKL